MNRLLLGATLCLFSLFAAPSAEAGHHGHGGHSSARPYHRTHGTRFSGGYYYSGRSHSHWGHRCWDTSSCRYNYWDPSLSCYYYYCPSRCGYYPCR